jgi:hypothetical protein
VRASTLAPTEVFAADQIRVNGADGFQLPHFRRSGGIGGGTLTHMWGRAATFRIEEVAKTLIRTKNREEAVEGSLRRTASCFSGDNGVFRVKYSLAPYSGKSMSRGHSSGEFIAGFIVVKIYTGRYWHLRPGEDHRSGAEFPSGQPRHHPALTLFFPRLIPPDSFQIRPTNNFDADNSCLDQVSKSDCDTSFHSYLIYCCCCCIVCWPHHNHSITSWLQKTRRT